MTAKSERVVKKDVTASNILSKLTSDDGKSNLFKDLLSTQLRGQLSDKENMLLAGEITLSRFRQIRELKKLFANNQHFANHYLLQVAKKSAFPAQDLAQFFDILLHAQGQDAYAEHAKYQYQQARQQLEFSLTHAKDASIAAPLPQAVKAQIGLTTTLSNIKTAKAKLAHHFSNIPKSFILLILPLYRQWVKTVGADNKAKRLFLNAVSFALIERQLSTLSLPKEAKIKRIKALRLYLKHSGMLDKIWQALKMANLSFNSQALNKGTLKRIESIYQQCEALLANHLAPLQKRVEHAVKLCQDLAKLYAQNPAHGSILIQQARHLHAQYLACINALRLPLSTIAQIENKIERTQQSLDNILKEVLAYQTSAYARNFRQILGDFFFLSRQKLWLSAMHSLATSPLRSAKEIAALTKNHALLTALDEADAGLITREARLLQSAIQPSEIVNEAALFTSGKVIHRQFAQIKAQKAIEDINHHEKEAAVFAPRIKT